MMGTDLYAKSGGIFKVWSKVFQVNVFCVRKEGCDQTTTVLQPRKTEERDLIL